MTHVSKQVKKSSSRLVDLSIHSDEELHSLMDSVTAEMARRASVNARRREVMRRLENLAEAEGMTLDEVRGFLKGTRVTHKQEATGEPKLTQSLEPSTEEPLEILAFEQPEQKIKAKPPAEPTFRNPNKPSLDSQFESMMKRELADLA